MHPSPDAWRRQINRAVRDFASSGANSDDATRMFLNTMLREIGDALDLDCCALVDVAEPSASVCGVWSAMETGEPSRAVEGVAAIVQRMALDVDPALVRAEPDEGDT
ncbi:MAG TPA: hypothetical protein VG871_13965, partial [Vicinamibacterales bacterium]|nr:hypothetical protein [Vicinamibacterales bacterium]